VNGKQSLSDSFSSRYAPWQEKWAIGTGAVGQGTPPAVRAAVAQGVLVPGSPGLFAALKTVISPTPPSPAVAEPPPAPVAPNPAPVVVNGAPAVSGAPSSATGAPASVPETPTAVKPRT